MACQLPEGEKHVELAYFGGSFTGLNKADMRFLLAVVRRLLDEGRIDAARVSTRPDYVSPDSGRAQRGRVTTVELGVQSMSDRVLAACRRGHTAADTVRAFEILRCAGLNVVGQMMSSARLDAGGRDKHRALGFAIWAHAPHAYIRLWCFATPSLENVGTRRFYALPLCERFPRGGCT